jgi:5-methylcytosine-specific restriction endonuclease McrA
LSDISLTRFQRCGKCGCTKPKTLEFFGRSKDHRDGLETRCKTCMRRKYREWAAVNKERKAAYDKQRRDENPERHAATYRNWFLKNRERRYEYRRRRMQENEDFRLRVRHSSTQRRRNIKYTQAALDYVPVLRCDPCSYCGQPAESVDHIVPVIAGGSSDWDNLTAACRQCNSSKRERSLLAFLLDSR